jgi:2-C-methyl-D-erythritol 4-phosphate cytidylyltransferase/2-C-methyl-D-erythritol 2,4-cyclodiphosphate synthase
LVLLNPIFGGDTRQDSVRLGLESFHDITPKSILIHDAARPFINTHIINQLLETLDEGELGVIPGILQTDTLKRAKNNIVTDTIDRTDLWSVQTPQAFNYQAILKAHRYAGDTQSTDDSSIMEQSGTKVIIIQGSNENFKITIADDLTRGERCLLLNEAQKVTRIGIGFDVHRFESGKSVILCGIEIPFSKSLEGHSDADVGMHAITDALFGAIGVGDIGLFFPPSDPQWKDVSSDVFLSRAGKEIANYGAAITNIDLTIICEAPKIANYRDLMRNNIANILNISYAQINIKGTTTERLGFTGRGEGIAAEAVASVTM